jgi:cyclophilin family peptidyl-prolyl cis-trans isomerase
MRKLVLLGASCLVLAGCGGSGSSSGSGSPSGAGSTSTSASQTAKKDAAGCVPAGDVSGAPRRAPKPRTKLDPAKTYELTLATNCGSFTIRLDQAQSPNATASIVSLAKRGYFDRTVFHRIVQDFVIQGGDPTGTGTGGPGYSTVDPPPATAKYTHGVVAMAKTAADAPGTAGSQFFVVTAADVQLTPDYAIVGKVVRGLGVVDRIGRLGDANEQPTKTVEILKATVRTR